MRSSATAPFSKIWVPNGRRFPPCRRQQRGVAVDEVISSGDLGYALGVVAVRMPSGPELTTKYATIWQRDADGRWRLAVDSSSPNP
jgi:ketosteroid isomerase-like protein